MTESSWKSRDFDSTTRVLALFFVGRTSFALVQSVDRSGIGCCCCFSRQLLTKDGASVCGCGACMRERERVDKNGTVDRWKKPRRALVAAKCYPKKKEKEDDEMRSRRGRNGCRGRIVAFYWGSTRQTHPRVSERENELTTSSDPPGARPHGCRAVLYPVSLSLV
jgi:hypothetical protein